ncbi:rod shape-determining protein MreD [Sandaracinobacteroides saxicola]|uniref:Rod shape-determining protein MreD n=1 Tax=Sandaracinobacteroides saxicola TaxID=2759707 RepID=A0A7G5IGF0_9SPHN|nr:rod shape-determining protein MreD [Sandaracinobacteroides saxicola]QMW22442.1 rod shape-determining protein MreD [Sandaracinobacteroides saxicola]
MTGVDSPVRLSDRLPRALPTLSIALAALLMSAPLPLPLSILPNLPLLLLICWLWVMPSLLPSWLAFLLGLLLDAVTGAPLGLNATLFALAVVAVPLSDTMMDAHSLLLDWLFAALLIIGFQLLSWGLLALVNRPVAPLLLLAQAGTSILAYPLAVWLVERLQRRLIRS